MASGPRPEWLVELLPAAARAALGEALSGVGPPVRACALSPVARVLALAGLARRSRRPLWVVVPDESRLKAVEAELRALLTAADDPEVLRFPALDADPYRGMPAHPAVAAQRVGTLDRLAAWGARDGAGGGTIRGGAAAHPAGDPGLGRPPLVVLPATALLVPVPTPAAVRGWARTIERGAEVDLDEFARTVVRHGYRVVDVVGGPGDFARRGGLFDIWPPQEDAPLRVELFGDEVESVRRFDAATQRTVAHIPSFRLLPAREAPIGPDQADQLLDTLVGRAREVLADIEPTEEGLPRLLEEMLAGLEGAPSLYRDDLVPVARFIDAEWVVWDPEEVEGRIAQRLEEFAAAHGEERGERLPTPDRLYPSLDELAETLRAAPVVLAELPLVDDLRRAIVDLGGRPPRRYHGQLESLPKDLGRALDEGRPVVLLLKTAGRRARLAEILADARLPFRESEPGDAWEPGPGEIVLAHGALDEGVEFRGEEALVVAEPDLFGEDPPPPPSKRRRGTEAFVSDLRDLKQDDFVVHVDHGVGRYVGLTKRPITGEELLVLEYAGGDRLYVPVTRLDLIQKYSAGSEHVLTPLDRLGGPGWEKRRRKVSAAVEEMAGELLELYAKRRAVKAPVFALDSAWQREFESAFPHPLTNDQAAALADIKGDLVSGRPMDRLLCGDVGFGKTEVALRAAFKVVQEGHQVAVLAPTTVLAFQHLNTFRARMAAWPVRIEMVSRFVAPAEIKRVLEATARGEVDILVGTHRLLSKDVRFRRLGLLIVDEEQRFGVRHKETIKGLALGVHALPLTATPIPRTLQMSLAGVRDLSVIETPPRNRHAIQTHIAAGSGALVAAAIRNELRRNGQVYVITPRVQGIEELEAELRALVPEARIAHGHGQMADGELERVMLGFIRAEIDVLLATSIIENGLDIPRANTIIVRDAHAFGLAQLYQMRGRVGRSDQRAYAYLMVPPRRELSSDARRRLAALVEFTALGSGFRIAALDLEIRGAGEFLGARQSGHIAAVGFELYAQLLEQAVRRLSGQPLPEPREPVAINLDLPSHLPEEFVPEPGQRLAIYKRLAAAESVDEVRAVRDETIDRYGRLPDPAATLFRIGELRVLAEQQGAVAIDWAGDAVAVRYGRRPQVDTERIIGLVQRDPDIRLSPTGVVRLRVPDPRADRITVASLALRKLAG